MAHSNGITAMQLSSLNPSEFGKETEAAASRDLHRNMALNCHMPVAMSIKDVKLPLSCFVSHCNEDKEGKSTCCFHPSLLGSQADPVLLQGDPTLDQ